MQNLVELDGYIGAANAEAVAESIATADAAVIGPGLGRNRETDEFVRVAARRDHGRTNAWSWTRTH